MTPRTIRRSCRSLAFWAAALVASLSGPSAKADGLYTITDLGTLSGQSSSVATSINNQGQVVGISYNAADGSFEESVYASGQPPRFTQNGNGAESFLFSGGQMSQINPTGGLAMSINNSGQVVGGPFVSINDAGQYAGGGYGGVINNPNQTTSPQLISGGASTSLGFTPYAINNAGQVVGGMVINGGTDSHPVLYQNGQLIDLFSKIGSGEHVDSRAVAINQNGDILITYSPQENSLHSFLYKASTGHATEIPQIATTAGIMAAALNIKDQVVGNGFLYSNGSTEALTGLLPTNSGWTNLNATGINDSGQIVGQGTYDGQQVAFLMTPDSIETPEPGAIFIWALIGLFAATLKAARSLWGPVGDRLNTQY
jgi:probable HAF family extracellular repeat protein